MLLSNDGVPAMARTCPDRRVHRDGGADLALRPGLRAHRRDEAGVEQALQSQVDREPHVGTAHRGPVLGERDRHAPRVDVQALPPVGPAQHRVVLLLEPGAADDLPRRQARPALLVLGRGHPHEAEHRSEQRALRIGAARLGDHEDAGDPGRGHRVADAAWHLGHRQRQARLPRRGELGAPAPRAAGRSSPASRSTSAGRARSRAGTTSTRSTPVPASAASMASGTSCRSVIEPRGRAAGSSGSSARPPTTWSASPRVTCIRQP